MGNKLVRLFPIHFPAVVTAVQRQITVISPVPCGSGNFYFSYLTTNSVTYSPAKVFPFCQQPMQIVSPENACQLPSIL